MDEPPCEFMRLDDAALVALDVFESSADNAPKSNTYTLCALLDKCRTTGGKNLLSDWLKKPLCNLEQISQRLDIVEALNNSSECRHLLHRDLLRRVHDLGPLSQKLVQKKASLDDCYRLYKNICSVDSMCEALAEIQEYQAVKDLILTPLEKSRKGLEKLVQLLQNTVHIDELTNEVCIKPDVDEALSELDTDIKRLQKKAEGIAGMVRDETGADTVKLDSNIETGFFLRVSLKGEKNIRSAKMEILTTTKGAGVTFTNPDLKRLNPDFCSLHEQYEEAQKAVCQSVIETCGTYTEACKNLSENIAFVDVLVAFSTVCCTSANAYVRPELLEKGEKVFELRECRHPIVESLPFASSYIPNDITFDQGCRFSVLTGPNMGGKSTFLKSAAITVLLAQIGCFVPCASARFSLIDGIFCRVGAGDIQHKGISTFMHEMKDVSTILQNATPDSLVIIDELGRGTSTFDGFGLAYATAEEIIRNCDSLVLFATHFHEMAQLQKQFSLKVQNLKVETYLDENGTLTILYKISEGVSERSFGINIAKMVGFPEEIINEAQRLLDGLEKRSASESELFARQLISQSQEMNPEEVRFTLCSLPEEKLN